MTVDVAAWFDGPNGPLWTEVVKLFHSRQIFRSFERVITDSPSLVRQDGGEFIRWTRRNYVDAQVAAIRRLSGRRKDEISLRRALLAAKKDPPPSWTKSRVASDLTHLDQITERVVGWANDFVAHLATTARPNTGLTYAELHETVDDIGGMFGRYEAAYHGVATSMEVLMPPWEHVFAVAWAANR